MSKIITLSMPEIQAVPEPERYAKMFLDAEAKQAEGDLYRVVAEERSWDNVLAGMEYSNRLVVSKQCGGEWQKVYESDFQVYRPSMANELDRPDLHILATHIIVEEEDRVVFALQMADGRINTFELETLRESAQPKRIGSFDNARREAIIKSNSLVDRVANDVAAFAGQVKAGLAHRWHAPYKFHCDGENVAILDEGSVVVMLFQHSDRDYDAVTDCYKLAVWVKGHGGWVSGEKYTALCHPLKRFHHVPVWLAAALRGRSENSILLDVGVHNNSQDKHFEEVYKIELG